MKAYHTDRLSTFIQPHQNSTKIFFAFFRRPRTARRSCASPCPRAPSWSRWPARSAASAWSCSARPSPVGTKFIAYDCCAYLIMLLEWFDVLLGRSPKWLAIGVLTVPRIYLGTRNNSSRKLKMNSWTPRYYLRLQGRPCNHSKMQV